MIRVGLAQEPSDFDEKVRQKGLNAIAELVGEKPSKKRRGRKREKIADTREEIPPEKFPPIWRDAIDDLLQAYNHICAYMCIYIEPITGAASVDHMLAKSQTWNQIYEWNNYRLACSTMNSRKGVIPNILDPMEIENDWFMLELVGFQIIPATHLSEEIQHQVDFTITELGLNDWKCTNLRESYVEDYWNGDISSDYLKRRAPFVAMELERQGRLS